MQKAHNRLLEGARVLIAEDSALQAWDLMTLLKKAGAEIVGPAKTVAEVLALAEKADPSCAILDVILGHQPVFPAANALKQRGVAIVFYTGSADLKGLGRDWPDAKVLPKPVSPIVLLEAVTAACQCSAEPPL